MTAHKCKNLSEWLSIGTHFHFARLADSVHLRGPSMFVAHPAPGPLTATYHGPPCAVAHGHCQPYLDVAPAHPTPWALLTLHRRHCPPMPLPAHPMLLPLLSTMPSRARLHLSPVPCHPCFPSPRTGSEPRLPPAPHLSPKNPFCPCPAFRLCTVTVQLPLPQTLCMLIS